MDIFYFSLTLVLLVSIRMISYECSPGLLSGTISPPLKAAGNWYYQSPSARNCSFSGEKSFMLATSNNSRKTLKNKLGKNR